MLLTFGQRITIACIILIGTALFCAPILTWGWGGVLAAISLILLAAFLVRRWLLQELNETCHDYSRVLKELLQHLPAGRKATELKSLRPNDPLGRLSIDVNQVLESTASEVRQLLEKLQQLEQNKTLFQSILGTMVEGVIVLDSQQRVLFFNETARRMLDCTTRNFTGRPLWELVRLPDLTNLADAVFRGEQPSRREIELPRSKSILDVTSTLLPLSPDPGAVFVLHDVTEVRRLERMRREFVSNVSHELKTPLTSIQVCADTLLDGGMDDAEYSERFLKQIIEQSNRLQTLIQDMLRLARIESHAEAFHFSTVSLKQILSLSINACQSLAEAKGIRVQFETASPDALVSVDANGLQTIFDNLITNAIHYNRPGGWVKIEVQLHTEQVEIRVRDNGLGIPAEQLGRIFERFYRIDKARTIGQGGTGLGLAIVKHLVSVFHGELDVNSDFGHGSEFRVKLPLSQFSAE